MPRTGPPTLPKLTRPCVIDRADLGVDVSQRQRDLADRAFDDVGIDLRGLLRPRGPDRRVRSQGMSPEVRIENEQIKTVLKDEVIKREVMEGDKAAAAQKRAVRASKQSLRSPSVKTARDSAKEQSVEVSAQAALAPDGPS